MHYDAKQILYFEKSLSKITTLPTLLLYVVAFIAMHLYLILEP